MIQMSITGFLAFVAGLTFLAFINGYLVLRKENFWKKATGYERLIIFSGIVCIEAACFKLLEHNESAIGLFIFPSVQIGVLTLYGTVRDINRRECAVAPKK